MAPAGVGFLALCLGQASEEKEGEKEFLDRGLTAADAVAGQATGEFWARTLLMEFMDSLPLQKQYP